ncbi:hypothetical protein [Paracoccus sp. T5]|uniref:hypothetical protein n=1 Tax=Paracoccus sp. T5 TaxID=3402161 RepID=UPI003ADB47E7
MTIRSLSLALGTALALAGCVSSTEEQVTSQPSTAETRTLADVGIDVGTAEDTVSRVGTNNVVNAGLAAGMGQSFGGAGLAAGALGWLTSPGAGLAGDPNLILTLPAGATTASYERKYSEALYSLYGQDLEAQGYSRVVVQKAPHFATFIKPGCKLTRHGYYATNCSISFIASITKPTGGGSGNAYVLKLSSTGNWITNYEALAKRMADRHPELSLYLPPRREAGTMAGPRLYKNGRITSL